MDSEMTIPIVGRMTVSRGCATVRCTSRDAATWPDEDSNLVREGDVRKALDMLTAEIERLRAALEQTTT